MNRMHDCFFALPIRSALAVFAAVLALSGRAGVAPGPSDAAPEREQTRQELIEDVARSWRRPEVRVDGEIPPEASTTASPIAAKLDRIVVPAVSFTKATLAQVVATLTAAAEEYDSTAGSRRGVNLVLLDPGNRAPTVTLTLREVTLRRLLDFVTAAVGYDYEIQADAVVLRPEGDAAAMQTAFFPITRATAARLTGQNAGPAPVLSAVRKGSPAGAADDATALAGGDAAAMRRFFQLAGVNFDAAPGASLAYDGSAIIVTQTVRNLERVRNILARYREVRQVEIEAKFMEVQEGALEELGVNWSAATRTASNAATRATLATGNRTLAGTFTSRSSSQQGGIARPEGSTVAADGTVTVVPEFNLPIINNAPQLPGATELGAAAAPLAAVAGVIGDLDVNAVVRALSQKQGTDLLSAPKVTVLSGNQATITVAQEMRYPQNFGQTQSQVGTGNASGGGSAGVAITAGTPQEFTARNIGVELKVTPTVEDDNTSISLDLNPKVTEFDGFVEYGGPSIAISGSTTVTVPSGFYQPIFSVRDISTKVTIWDGATLMMGGLTREEVKKVHDKVPILGDLPLLGRLFRTKGETTQKRNLLIFVRASLVNPGGGRRRADVARVEADGRADRAEGKPIER